MCDTRCGKTVDGDHVLHDLAGVACQVDRQAVTYPDVVDEEPHCKSEPRGNEKAAQEKLSTVRDGLGVSSETFVGDRINAARL